MAGFSNDGLLRLPSSQHTFRIGLLPDRNRANTRRGRSHRFRPFYESLLLQRANAVNGRLRYAGSAGHGSKFRGRPRSDAWIDGVRAGHRAAVWTSLAAFRQDWIQRERVGSALPGWHEPAVSNCQPAHE